MFKNSISLMSIFLHGLACLSTTQWLLHSWQISSYWIIFLICIFIPATVETITIICSFVGPNKDL
ncbi:hypothetical protein O3M35_012693 [Rhynocoris fuscipes]|uniref:Transmembrane protein 107 n=1 Tax=Rhynocoris fuscipes TaxID=488301 RepID=A0AAW1CTZ4_9HEMI